MKKLGDNWFSEVHETLWPGRALSLQVDKVIYEDRSEFQDICVFESVGVGRVLTLDGIIQLTGSDEFAYQEMLTHVPMFAHPDPRHVLVIGGGDGGILREVTRHDCVERVDLCEIDGDVVDVAKKYLPFTACGFEDPRVHVHIQDGAKFMQDRPGQYDVIIVDSSDPVGPAEVLFKEPFYRSMSEGLKAGGVAINQAESMWLHGDLIQSILTMARGIYKQAHYCYTCVPTYPSGQIGFLVASNELDARLPGRQPDEKMSGQLRYYTPEIHRAAFHLPAFAAKLQA
jgi:spermidine synthase